MKIISKNKIDIIHSNTYVPAIAGYTCSRMFRKPHVVTYHDLYFLNRKSFWKRWDSQGHSIGLVSLAGPLVERSLLKLPKTAYHTVSETSKEDLLLAGVRNVTVVPNGINLIDFPNPSSTEYDRFQAVFIGRLVFYKNLDVVIQAFKKVAEKIPQAKLIVIGDGPMKSGWVALVNRLGLRSKVVFAGRVNHKEKVNLLQRSSFLVHPSVIEGFGIVILEAFACRKSALVSAVKPLTDIIENGREGYVVPPFDVEAWADMMIYLFNNPLKTLKMGTKGREKLERSYTIPRVVDRLEEFYSNVVACNTKNE